MNLRKIKLALTVGLINGGEEPNALNSIKEMMNRFIDEIGNFVDLVITNQMAINASFTQRTVAIRYENMVLNVDLIMNTNTQSQHIQNFNIG